MSARSEYLVALNQYSGFAHFALIAAFVIAFAVFAAVLLKTYFFHVTSQTAANLPFDDSGEVSHQSNMHLE